MEREWKKEFSRSIEEIEKIDFSPEKIATAQLLEILEPSKALPIKGSEWRRRESNPHVIYESVYWQRLYEIRFQIVTKL